jgi:hypothetical protein
VFRPLLALNALVGLLGCLLAVALTREALRPLPLLAPSAPRPAPAAPAAAAAPAPPGPAGAYGVIAARNLFSPSRSEGASSGAVAAGPRPLLHGVVMDGPKSRAYLEDPAAKRTFAYTVGDAVAGGRVQAIKGDRVIIARPDGLLEVLLQDPDKPKPVTAAPVAAPAAAATPAGAATPAVGTVRRPVPAVLPGGRQ